MTEAGSISINQQREIISAISNVAETFALVDLTAGTARINVNTISDNNGGRIIL